MILAVDPGLATFGWAVVARTGAVRACGVLVSKPDPKRTKAADRVRRASDQAALVQRLASTYLARAIVAETMSFAPRSSASAKIGIGMSWGGLIGVAAARGVPLLDVPPKTWQRAIVPAAPGESDRAAIDYDQVFTALAAYVDPNATGLAAVPKGQRNHALDACGVGVYAALLLVPQLNGGARP